MDKRHDVFFTRELMTWNVSIYGGNNMCKWNYYARLVRNWDEGLGAKYYRLSKLPPLFSAVYLNNITARTALRMGEAATGTHLRARRANLLDKLIKFAINLGRPCAPLVYETVEESFIMRTIQPPLGDSFAIFTDLYVKRYSVVCALITTSRGAPGMIVMLSVKTKVINREPAVSAYTFSAYVMYVKDDTPYSLSSCTYLSTVVHRICMETIRERNVTFSLATYVQPASTFCP